MNIQITEHLLDNISLGLPQALKSTLDTKEIELILTIQNEYNRKGAQNDINETAFMSVEQYIEDSFSKKTKKTLSQSQIQAVFNALDLYFF